MLNQARENLGAANTFAFIIKILLVFIKGTLAWFDLHTFNGAFPGHFFVSLDVVFDDVLLF